MPRLSTHARTGALWAGTVVVEPNASPARMITALSKLSSTSFEAARMRWVDRLNSAAKPAWAPLFMFRHTFHTRRLTLSPTNHAGRSGQDPTVVNLEIESPEPI